MITARSIERAAYAHAHATKRGSEATRCLEALVAELYEVEEETYRLALLHAVQTEARGEPSVGARAVVGLVGEMLVDLRAVAHTRGMTVGSISALVNDAIHRIRDAAFGAPKDIEQRSEAAQSRGIDLVRRLQRAAFDESD